MDRGLKKRDWLPYFQSMCSGRINFRRWAKEHAVTSLIRRKSKKEARAKKQAGAEQSVRRGIKQLSENKVKFDVSSNGSIVVSPSEYRIFLNKK